MLRSGGGRTRYDVPGYPRIGAPRQQLLGKQDGYPCRWRWRVLISAMCELYSALPEENQVWGTVMGDAGWIHGGAIRALLRRVASTTSPA
jgi:hypothetical protein